MDDSSDQKNALAQQMSKLFEQNALAQLGVSNQTELVQKISKFLDQNAVAQLRAARRVLAKQR